MSILNDIFFANVSGSHEDNHYLDLYVPEKYGVSNSKVCGSVHEDGSGGLEFEFLKAESDNDNDHRRKKDHCDSVSRRTERPAANDVTMTHGVDDPNVNDSDINTGDTPASDVPLVIFVHGGGWRRGGRQAWTHYLYFDVNLLVVLLVLLAGTYKNVGQALASKGIACAVISYPLTEAGLLCLLAELCLSYLASCFAVLLASAPVIAISYVELGTFLASDRGWWTQLQINKDLNLKTYILVIMLITNIVTTFLLSIKRKEFKLKIFHIRLLWLCLVVGYSAISLAGNNTLLLSVILSFIANQFIILRLRWSRCGGDYEDQTRVLAKAVRWAKTGGNVGKPFSTRGLFLMGHSAGGHLVSLTALHDDILASEGCSHDDIKGVVSLSGVYDLMCLCGPILRKLYLQPTFGHSETTWRRASPSHIMKTQTLSENKPLPKFLLMVAENDLFLKQQSLQFSEILQEANVDCDHIEILGTNHLTIVTSLVKKFTGNEKSVLVHIMHFIHNLHTVETM